MAKAKTQQTETATKQKTTTIQIDVSDNVGRDLVLKNGDVQLVVKIGDGFVLPDFSDALFRAFEADAHLMALLGQNAYRRNVSGDALRAACADVRDRVFNSVK